jgi:hypothetical protein
LVLDFSSFFSLIDFLVEDFVSFKALALGDFFISTSFSTFFYLVGFFFSGEGEGEGVFTFCFLPFFSNYSFLISFFDLLASIKEALVLSKKSDICFYFLLSFFSEDFYYLVYFFS